MKVMSSVPTTSGTMPKAPDEPTWSARIAVCGDHCRPNRKSIGETLLKKRKVSNSDREHDADGGEHGDRRTGEQNDRGEALEAIAGAEVRARCSR